MKPVYVVKQVKVKNKIKWGVVRPDGSIVNGYTSETRDSRDKHLTLLQAMGYCSAVSEAK